MSEKNKFLFEVPRLLLRVYELFEPDFQHTVLNCQNIKLIFQECEIKGVIGGREQRHICGSIVIYDACSFDFVRSSPGIKFSGNVEIVIAAEDHSLAKTAPVLIYGHQTGEGTSEVKKVKGI